MPRIKKNMCVTEKILKNDMHKNGKWLFRKHTSCDGDSDGDSDGDGDGEIEADDESQGKGEGESCTKKFCPGAGSAEKTNTNTIQRN